MYRSFVLDKGEFNQINVRGGGVSASIYADKPVLVVMFMKSQDGAGNALVHFIAGSTAQFLSI